MAAKLSDLATGFRPEISCPALWHSKHASFYIILVKFWVLYLSVLAAFEKKTIDVKCYF
jgi:hypothetical protein